MSGVINIGQLNRFVIISSSQVEIKGGSAAIHMSGVRKTWAMIQPKTQSSLFTDSGDNIEEKPTHTATIRYMADLDISNSGWLQEVKMISPNLWYRIIGIKESPDGNWMIFELRLEMKSDAITDEKQVTTRPAGFNL